MKMVILFVLWDFFLENACRVWVLRQKFLQNISNLHLSPMELIAQIDDRMLLGHDLEIMDRRTLQWKCRCSQTSRDAGEFG